MKANERLAPRINAGNRAKSKTEPRENSAAAIELEADAEAVWFDSCLPIPSALVRILAALASLRRAFG